jgi:hypothetical protein
MPCRLSNAEAPKTIDELLQKRARLDSLYRERGELLTFRTPEGHDVYNITAPFEYEGRLLIAGRTEARFDETQTLTRFFRCDSIQNTWVHDDSLPSLSLQDPFVMKAQGYWLVGGVKVFAESSDPSKVAGWETHIYAGKDLDNLELLTVGPYKMKDIRLVEQSNKEIAVFTRPQGEIGGLGKIGYVAVKQLEDINAKVLQGAPLIPELFSDEQNEWGGVNEAHVLEDGRIGVVGHIARYVKETDSDNSLREYYPMTFIFDPTTHTVSNQQIIASRNNFPATESKKFDTQEVLFSGGIRILGKLATWYGGVSDTHAGKLANIPNPFLLKKRTA